MSFFAFSFALTGCGSKTFDSVEVTRGSSVGIPRRVQQPVNVTAVADSAIGQWRTFAWLAVGSQAKEQPAPVILPEPSPVVASTTVATVPTASPSSLPPEYICQRESHCTYGINTGNGYFGKWQFSLDWGGHFGLPEDITTWTPAQEDEAARQLWANGAGCSNWDACR